MQPIPTTDYLWQRVAMDVVGPLPESNKGNKYILVIMEYTSKYVIAVAMKDMLAKTVARKFIKHVINKEGVPTEILTDQGTNFQSATMKELCSQLGIKQLRTTAYHPQTDGAVEKFNRTLGDMLAMHVEKNPGEWDEYLDYCVGTYNKTPHTSTKDTPFYLLKGRDALEPTDVRPPMRNRILEEEGNTFSRQWHDALETARANSVVAQARQKDAYDKGTGLTHYETGDLVLLKELKAQTGKFYMRWDGPFVVVAKLSNLNYSVRRQDSNHAFVVHVNRMKRWKSKTDQLDTHDNVQQTSNESPDEIQREATNINEARQDLSHVHQDETNVLSNRSQRTAHDNTNRRNNRYKRKDSMTVKTDEPRRNPRREIRKPKRFV